MEGLNKITNQERSIDPFLNQLWEEYDFPGTPPFFGSVAETRLKEACLKYASFIDSHLQKIPGDDMRNKGLKGISSSDEDRRNIHNQIAIMVVGKKRSGMDEKLAIHIADFAYEYARGYTIKDAEKYKQQTNEVI